MKQWLVTKERSGQFGDALQSHLTAVELRQRDATRLTLAELHQTRDSERFGADLRELDTLIPAGEPLTGEEKIARRTEILTRLINELGKGGAILTYRTWVHQQTDNPASE